VLWVDIRTFFCNKVVNGYTRGSNDVFGMELKVCLHYLIFNWSFYLTNIIEKIFKESRMHSIFIFRLSDLICEFSFELMSFAVIIIIKFFLNSSFFYYCF
jgi:hypothetical protein